MCTHFWLSLCAPSSTLRRQQICAPPNRPCMTIADQWRYDWDGFPRSNQPDIPASMLKVPVTRSVAARGTRFTTAYVPAPLCAPSRCVSSFLCTRIIAMMTSARASCLILIERNSFGCRGCLASGREYDMANVQSNSKDYPIDQSTFYMVMRNHGYGQPALRTLPCRLPPDSAPWHGLALQLPHLEA